MKRALIILVLLGLAACSPLVQPDPPDGGIGGTGIEATADAV